MKCPMTAIIRKAGLVVPVNVAPNEPPTEMKWLRGKPVPIAPIASKISKT